MNLSHLDKKILDELKEKLERQKEIIESELSSIAKKSDSPKGDWQTKYQNLGDDWDENVLEVTTYATNLSLERTLEMRLKNITDALERMETGKYGFCEADGKPIPLPRLRAKPEARVCLDHRQD